MDTIDSGGGEEVVSFTVLLVEVKKEYPVVQVHLQISVHVSIVVTKPYSHQLTNSYVRMMPTGMKRYERNCENVKVTVMYIQVL